MLTLKYFLSIVSIFFVFTFNVIAQENDNSGPQTCGEFVSEIMGSHYVGERSEPTGNGGIRCYYKAADDKDPAVSYGVVWPKEDVVNPANDNSSEASEYTGGAHEETKTPPNDKKDSHHCPAKSSYTDAPISSEKGPAIKMDPADHKKTASYGSSDEAKKYRQQQRDLLNQGRLMDAIQMDIDDIRSKFGNKYDAAIEEMLAYAKTLDPECFKS